MTRVFAICIGNMYVGHVLRILLIWIVTSSGAAADVVSPGGKTVDCYCTDSRGSRVELGQFKCLHVGGRSFTAQCQMSLNVPMWREISQGCLSSALPQSLQPSLDPGLVDPKI